MARSAIRLRLECLKKVDWSKPGITGCHIRPTQRVRLALALHLAMTRRVHAVCPPCRDSTERHQFDGWVQNMVIV